MLELQQSLILGCMEHSSARVQFFLPWSPVPPRPKVKDERGSAAAGWLLVDARILRDTNFWNQIYVLGSQLNNICLEVNLVYVESGYK